MKVKKSSRIKYAVFIFTLEEKHCPKCKCKREFEMSRGLLGITDMTCKKCKSKFEIHKYKSRYDYIAVPADHKYLDPEVNGHYRQRKGVVL